MNPRKRHNRRVKRITAIMTIAAIISGMALDSDSYAPLIVLAIAVIYLLIFCIANMEK